MVIFGFGWIVDSSSNSLLLYTRRFSRFEISRDPESSFDILLFVRLVLCNVVRGDVFCDFDSVDSGVEWKILRLLPVSLMK